MSGDRDAGYKPLFAHPELVRDLLAGFTPFACFREPNVAAFERINGSYVSEQFSERHNDMVWRVRTADSDPKELARSRNLVAALFRLELSDSPDVLKAVLATLTIWLSSDEQAPLRHSMERWIARLKKREFPGLVITREVHFLEGGEMGERFQRQYATWEDFLKATQWIDRVLDAPTIEDVFAAK